jgi:hypothetical protein
MKDFQYYSCPVAGTIVLPSDKTYLTKPCDAGCGRVVVYDDDLEPAKPKVCRICCEWVQNTEGTA